MDQELLPEIEPYVNRNLFSDHFLRELLPDDESWAVDEDKVRLAMQAALNLYAPRKEELPHLNEAQLEQELVRPMLESLGHVFQVQPSLPTSEGVRRPDYAFFATREDKRQAGKHKGKLDYFKKAIAIGDAKQWGRPLDKRQRGGTDKFDMVSPSWQIDYYLRTSEVPWAILTDGRFWRLFNRETSFRLDVYYEIDLPQILVTRDIEAFKYFYLFFRRQAFVRDPEGLCFLDRVYQGSLEYARKVGDDLKDSVYKALRILAEGFAQTPGNDLDPGRDLETIHANALIYLYRLLFINYAEDRRLLPRDTPLYKETYGLVSMEGEIASKLERQESLSPLQATYWEKLRVLFDLINQGSEAFGIDKDTLFVPPYNGGLFDPEHHPFLEENGVADRWLAQVMDLLARSKGEGVGKAFVDYSSLDVRHLGSIYEGLLEYKLRVADQETAAIRRRGREEWVSASEAQGKKVLERVQPGQLYLVTDRGERKATGSFYTPDYIVKYIVENTLGPLIAEKKKDDEDPIQAILSLKVLDPAMGSGHFLVEATDRLAHALIEALGGSPDAEDDIRWARREVVERCIYGVDLNPLAVELAKLSLWLHTVAEGKPLNFLDHHLKVGNSLIGAHVEDLSSLPVSKKGAGAKEGEIVARQMSLFEQRLNEMLPGMLGKVLEITKQPSDKLEHIRAKEAADRAIAELKAPFKAAADLWVSTYFGNEVKPTEYDEALEHIGEREKLLTLPAVQRARQIADDKGFFHWEMEFPEVFYQDSVKRENPGFDAVVGNPPYVTFGGRWTAKVDRQLDAFLRKEFPLSAEYKLNTYAAFMDLAISYLRISGAASYIVPDSFLLGKYFSKLRRLVLNTCKIDRLVLMTFDPWESGEVGRSVVFVFRREESPVSREHHRLRAISWECPGIASGREFQYAQGLFRAEPDTCRFRLFFDPHSMRYYEMMRASSIDLRQALEPYTGLRSRVPKETIVSAEAKGALWRECLLAGENIDRYQLQRPGLFVKLDKALLWGGYDESKYLRPKIFLRKTGDSLVAALDSAGLFAFDNLHVLNLRSDGYDLLYLLALLNSKPLNLFYQLISLEVGRTLPQIDLDVLRTLPIRRICFRTPRKERSRLVREGKARLESLLSGTGAHMVQETYSAFLSSELGEWLGVHLDVETEQSDVTHDLLAYLAEQMIAMHKERQAEAKGFLDWLAGYIGLPIEDWRLKTIVKAYWEHPSDELQRALRQNRKAIEQASGRNVEGREVLESIQSEFDQSVAKLQPLLQRIASTDRLIDLIVYRLYGLTEGEVAIVEGE